MEIIPPECVPARTPTHEWVTDSDGIRWLVPVALTAIHPGSELTSGSVVCGSLDLVVTADEAQRLVKLLA